MRPWRETGGYTPEELMLEYLRYAVDNDPTEALPATDDQCFNVMTGDPIADAWERSLTETGTFDALNKEDEEGVHNWLAQK